MYDDESQAFDKAVANKLLTPVKTPTKEFRAFKSIETQEKGLDIKKILIIAGAVIGVVLLAFLGITFLSPPPEQVHEEEVVEVPDDTLPPLPMEVYVFADTIYQTADHLPIIPHVTVITEQAAFGRVGKETAIINRMIKAWVQALPLAKIEDLSAQQDARHALMQSFDGLLIP